VKTTVREPIKLIINADDYGYFSCVSRGILQAAKSGKLTATGVMANSPDLLAQLRWLENVDNLDLGVHLNLSYGQPLTAAMAEKLKTWNGDFPGVYPMMWMIFKGQISLDDVRNEWREQIDTCKGQGRSLQFLNSHEHMHMLPPLFKLALELAEEYRIPHVRLTIADWSWPEDGKALLRNMLIQTMQTINRCRFKRQAPIFLGFNPSGKLSYAYLERVFANLKPGKTYELMCHPGYFDPNEISEERLLSYHAWENELALLLSPELSNLYSRFGISLCRYSSLGH
jgi:predicted glycoside hydrolase/deacetylase ChbG (UPF0249 family)